jgi:hypothetical protein
MMNTPKESEATMASQIFCHAFDAVAQVLDLAIYYDLANLQPFET